MATLSTITSPPASDLEDMLIEPEDMTPGELKLYHEMLEQLGTLPPEGRNDGPEQREQLARAVLHLARLDGWEAVLERLRGPS